MKKIITALDYARRDGVSGVIERIRNLAVSIRRQGGPLLIIPSDVGGFAVRAEIDFGQWIARCPACGGAEFVAPEEPIFFCFGCANRANGGSLRPVIFPGQMERETIEALILERPVDESRGLDELERAFQARPLVSAQIIQPDGSEISLPLSRSWRPDETIDELRSQNEAVYAWLITQAGE